MVHYVTVEIEVCGARTLQEAAEMALHDLRNEEFSLTVGTKTGPQVEETFHTTDIEN